MPSTPIPDAGRHATIEFFEKSLVLKPLDIVEDRTEAQKRADGDWTDETPIQCLECGGHGKHIGQCTRLGPG